MPRKPVVHSNRLPYHVTARVNNRERFPVDLGDVWKILSFHSFEMKVLYCIQVHALVLMDNHFHLLLSTPEENLSVVMKRYIQSITESVHRKSGRTGRLFGARYYPSLIGSESYFACALKYIYRNPVRAGVCNRVEDYPYSTLRGLLGAEALPFPLSYPFQREQFLGMPNDTDRWVTWLNTPFKNEVEKMIRKGFKKVEFEFPKVGPMRKFFEVSDLLFVEQE